MTAKMERALRVIRDLDDSEQDAIADVILEELKDEAGWSERFANSPTLLSRLAARALEEDRTGRTEPLDLDLLDR